MNRLTQQQQAVYDYIRQCIITRGYGPTVREIGLHMEIRSPNGVVCHLRALEKKGMIRRSANKSRAIELSEPPLRADASLQIAGLTTAGRVQLHEAGLGQFNLSRLGSPADQYLLTVRDDHLSAQAIKAGDLLVISKQASPAPGQLVVAQIAETGAKVIGLVQSENGRLRVSPLVTQLPSTPQSPLNLVGVVVAVLRFYQ